MNKTFLHDGDLGDICGSLPAIRALGGGTLFIRASNITRVCLTPDKWSGIDKLLKAQPYITDVVEWKNYQVDYDMNRFRSTMNRALRQRRGMDTALCDWFLLTFGLSMAERDTAWLAVEPNRVARVVINRTGPGREEKFWYHNRWFPWARVLAKYEGESVFIGSPLEHEVFCKVFGEVPYHPTADLYEAARVIAGCDLFVGNQSCCFWIAEAMKKPLVLEVWRRGPNSLVFRPGAVHGIDENVTLPDLPDL